MNVRQIESYFNSIKVVRSNKRLTSYRVIAFNYLRELDYTLKECCDIVKIKPQNASKFKTVSNYNQVQKEFLKALKENKYPIPAKDGFIQVDKSIFEMYY